MGYRIYIPVITYGLGQGLEDFRLNRDEEDADRTISIRLDPKRKSMLFYKNDKCKGKAFFEFKMGAILPKCLSLTVENGLAQSDEIARWFREAAPPCREYLQNDAHFHKDTRGE